MHHLFNKYVGGAMITVRTPSDVWKIEKTQVILDRKWKLSSWLIIQLRYIYIFFIFIPYLIIYDEITSSRPGILF